MQQTQQPVIKPKIESNLNMEPKINSCGQTVDDLMPGYDSDEYATY